MKVQKTTEFQKTVYEKIKNDLYEKRWFMKNGVKNDKRSFQIMFASRMND